MEHDDKEAVETRERIGVRVNDLFNWYREARDRIEDLEDNPYFTMDISQNEDYMHIRGRLLNKIESYTSYQDVHDDIEYLEKFLYIK